MAAVQRGFPTWRVCVHFIAMGVAFDVLVLIVCLVSPSMQAGFV